MPESTHKHTILYAEDDSDDLYIVRQAFRHFDDSIRLEHASNGFELMELLEKLHLDNSLPCLVILDINMPGMNGKETLIRMKQSDKFNSIPVVLFTTSSADGDRAFAAKWGAHFITKPLVYDELEALARVFVGHCASEVSKRA